MKTKKIELYTGYYYDDGETREFSFASDGTRKPLIEEFRDVCKDEFGFKPDQEDVEGVYKAGDIYDYTTKKVYKIKLVKCSPKN